MNADPIGILGTGRVARMLATRLEELGRTVVLGSRTPGEHEGGEHRVVSLADAVTGCPVLVNATPGAASVEALTAIGPDLFDGKVLVDLANATTPAFDLVYPNASLGEALQAALPGAKVVKTMNTAAMALVVSPGDVPGANVFLSGDDAGAKEVAAALLRGFGWSPEQIVDLGGIRTARGPEHFFPWVPALAQAFGSPFLTVRVVHA